VLYAFQWLPFVNLRYLGRCHNYKIEIHKVWRNIVIIWNYFIRPESIFYA